MSIFHSESLEFMGIFDKMFEGNLLHHFTIKVDPSALFLGLSGKNAYLDF